MVKHGRTGQQLLAAITIAAAGLAFSSTVSAEVAEPSRPNFVLIIGDDISVDGRPFPRCKTRLYDSGIKTPLVVRWPNGFAKPGSVCNSLVSVIDIAPTILSLAGLEPPPSFQGVSMAALLTDPEKSIRQYVFAEHNWHGQIAHERMVRHGDYVYIRNAHPQLPQICGLDAQCPQQELRALAAQDKLTGAQMDPLLEPRSASENRHHNCEDPQQA